MNDDEELPRSSVAPTAAAPSRTGGASNVARRAPGRSVGVNGLKLILAALLVAINAFFVIAEYALVRSRRARLEVMREEGASGAALALEQLGNVNEYISAVQIGVTMTSIGDRRARRARARGDPQGRLSAKPSATASRSRSRRSSRS